MTTPGAELTGRVECNCGRGCQTCAFLSNNGAETAFPPSALPSTQTSFPLSSQRRDEAGGSRRLSVLIACSSGRGLISTYFVEVASKSWEGEVVICDQHYKLTHSEAQNDLMRECNSVSATDENRDEGFMWLTRLRDGHQFSNRFQQIN